MFKQDSVQQSINSLLDSFNGGSTNVVRVGSDRVYLANGHYKIRNSLGFMVEIGKQRRGFSFDPAITMLCTREQFLDIPMYIMYRSYTVVFNSTHVLSVDPKSHDNDIEVVDLQLPFEDCSDEDNFFSAQLLYPHFRKDHILALRSILPVVHDVNSRRIEMRNTFDRHRPKSLTFMGRNS